MRLQTSLRQLETDSIRIIKVLPRFLFLHINLIFANMIDSVLIRIIKVFRILKLLNFIMNSQIEVIAFKQFTLNVFTKVIFAFVIDSD